MNEHTPGPWTWWTSCSWRRLRNDNRGKSTDVLMPWVAKDGQPDIIVSEADMHLIAAAPDMLAALKCAIARADIEAAGFPHGREEGCQADYDQCVAAIAKAEGRS